MSLFILFLLFIVASGKFIDAQLLNDEKSKLYKKLQYFDTKIDGTKTPEIHLLLLNKILSFFNKHYNFKKNFFTSFLKTVIFSWLLTVSIILPYLSNFSVKIYKTSKSWHDFIPWYPTIVINLVFDFLTVYITLKILRKIVTSSKKMFFRWIFLDIIVAYSLVYLCYSALCFGNSFLFLNTDFLAEYHSGYKRESRNIKDFDFTYLTKTKQDINTSGFTKNADIKIIPIINVLDFNSFKNFNKALINAINPLKKSKQVFYDHYLILREGTKYKKFLVKIDTKNADRNRNSFIYPLTSFIPTLLFLLILFFLVLYKKLFLIFRWISSRYLKSNLENSSESEIEKFKPGMHLAVTVSLIATFLKFLFELFKLTKS